MLAYCGPPATHAMRVQGWRLRDRLLRATHASRPLVAAIISHTGC